MRTVLLASMAMLAHPVSAQIGNPAGMAPDTRMEAPGIPAPNQTNTQDRLFAQLLAAGGLAEVDLANLAVAKARMPATKEFAKRMVDDHTSANQKLAGIADKSKIPLPREPDQDHQKTHEDLDRQAGGFDLAYIRKQVVEHQKTAQLLEWEIGSGEDAELQRFAAEILPTVLQHLERARTLAAELSAQVIAERAP